MPVFAIRPGMVSLVRPTFRTVSIMPGIERRAPDRTEISSGFFGSPNFFPITFSVFAIAFATSSSRDFGRFPLLA